MSGSRIDAVFIRKSTDQQDDAAQKANVARMLRERETWVPERYWFTCTIARDEVQRDADFKRLMALVEAGKVGTVYIECQDRFGTGDVAELFTLLGKLATHGTALFDLRDGIDLTCKDDATTLKAFLGGLKSRRERIDLAYRTIRSRVNNFLDSGSWPTGTHPFGYGKANYDPEGRLLWVWQPINRSQGQVFYPDPDGTLVPAGPIQDKIPRKGRRDVIKLVPSNNPNYVRAVKLIFDLYTRVGLSRRASSAWLNREGLLFNGRAFSHPAVTMILDNPAYVGDTHFGKVQTGKLQSFDGTGKIVEVKGKRDGLRRDAEEHLIQRDTHGALIDRRTFELAQQRRAAERQRTSHSPRNPAYYLKQLFVCGHCGKGLTGRTEIGRDGRRTVVYVCGSYSAAISAGKPSECGYQRLTHEEAEQLLLDKIRELNLPFDRDPCGDARASLEARLARLGHDDDEAADQAWAWLREGVNAFSEYLIENYGVEYPVLPMMRKWAMNFYLGDYSGDLSIRRVSEALTDLRGAISAAEADAVQKARAKVASLEQDHRALTLAWAKASNLQQGVLKEEINRLEAELEQWKPRTVPLTQRIAALDAAEAERKAEREKLLAEWPALEGREKGEALRRLFKTVTLFWSKEFLTAKRKPSRPRKTARRGRWKFTLLRDRIQWAFATLDLDTCL
jgi:hypothetical protein